jgi:hypothetical protein
LNSYLVVFILVELILAYLGVRYGGVFDMGVHGLTASTSESSGMNIATSISSSAGPSTSTSAQSSGLTSGAKAGIGAGVAVVALIVAAIMVAVLVFCRRRKRVVGASAANELPGSTKAGVFVDHNGPHEMYHRTISEVDGTFRPVELQ